MNNAKKILLKNVLKKATSSLLAISLGLLALPSPSLADREVIYRNCTELQKVMNDHNGLWKVFKGFEKVRMMRRDIGYEKYTVFCNGGIVIDKGVGTVCRGYIGYSFSRIGGGADYYAAWGKTNGLPNFDDTGEGNYCRWIK